MELYCPTVRVSQHLFLWFPLYNVFVNLVFDMYLLSYGTASNLNAKRSCCGIAFSGLDKSVFLKKGKLL